MLGFLVYPYFDLFWTNPCRIRKEMSKWSTVQADTIWHTSGTPCTCGSYPTHKDGPGQSLAQAADGPQLRRKAEKIYKAKSKKNIKNNNINDINI